MGLPEEFRQWLQSRLYIIMKAPDKKAQLAIQMKVKKCFPGIKMVQQLKSMGAVLPGQATYKSDCLSIYEKISSDIRSLG